jgi:hypothetical protein
VIEVCCAAQHRSDAAAVIVRWRILCAAWIKKLVYFEKRLTARPAQKISAYSGPGFSAPEAQINKAF